MITLSVSAFQLLGEGVLTSHELVDGELPEEVRPIDQYTGVQLQYQLCVGDCSGPGIWKARSFLRPEQH